MTHKFIEKILEREGENPVLLNDCVLTMSDKRNRQLIFCLSGENDYVVRELEVIYADNHNRVSINDVSIEQDVEKYVLNALMFNN